jgi:magnesium-transporting ATPase (P-type)
MATTTDEEICATQSSREEVTSWHVLTIDETISCLRANEDLIEVGLTTAEVQQRLQEYGPNQLTPKKKTSLLVRIWRQLYNVLVGILIVVGVVSAIRAIMSTNIDDKTTNWIEVGLIAGVITINTYIGVVQERSAEAAADALKNMLSSEAVVRRDGKVSKVSATELVPGDVVLLSLGESIPADMRLVTVSNLATLEAALTGESLPIEKKIDPIKIKDGIHPEQVPLGDRQNMCYSATLVAQGSGVGFVVATGDKTQIGAINTLVNAAEAKKTDVEIQIDRVSKYLAIIIVACTLACFFTAYFMTGYAIFDAVNLALCCAVAMVPEGLNAIVTMVYAWATSNMAENNAIVRRLPAVETLGSVTIVCSDKTGTLTQNMMSLTAFVTSNVTYKVNVDSKERTNKNFFIGTEYASDEPSMDENKPSPAQEYIMNALAGGVLCSKCVLGKDGGREGSIGNPTEVAILRAAYFAGVDVDKLKKDCPVVSELPFSSQYKFMATVHEPVDSIDGPGLADKYIVYVKGAPDRLGELCSHQAKAGLLDQLESFDKSYWLSQIAALSSEGLRVLALCRAIVPKSDIHPNEQLKPEFVNGRREAWLTMIGLCAIMDPPRPECIKAISEAHSAGVRVAMITGDHKDTALAIGRMLNLVNDQYPEAITGPELEVMSDKEVEIAVMSHNIFARASPQNKIQIVKALQAKDQVCGMTGDGVNDAPALKAADMGVAMGKEGTDVAREASDIILADDNFATIVSLLIFSGVGVVVRIC